MTKVGMMVAENKEDREDKEDKEDRAVVCTAAVSFAAKYQPTQLRAFDNDSDAVHMLMSLCEVDQLFVLLVGSIASGKTALLQATVRQYYRDWSPKQYHSNILCINSLKEQGIQYYRNEVKTFCQTRSCIPRKKKIIVLDDLDTLPEQSQQIFRNCIDKYHKHVFFLCSCTNPIKVIENLQSRLTVLRIQPMRAEPMRALMDRICAEEGLIVDSDARAFLLQIANHSVKSIIHALEKIQLLGAPVDLALAAQLCTNIHFAQLEECVRHLLAGDWKAASAVLFRLHDCGYSVMDILDNFHGFLKTTKAVSEAQKYALIPLLCKYITIFHNIHEDEMELSLFAHNAVHALQDTTI